MGMIIEAAGLGHVGDRVRRLGQEAAGMLNLLVRCVLVSPTEIVANRAGKKHVLLKHH